jgi:serine/threonine protein kinase
MGAVSVGEIVGRGAFGEVYKATYMGTQVAVKQIMTSHVPSRMMQDIQSEFQKEVEVMQKLNHSNIVAYIGSSVVGNGVAGMMCYAFFLQCCVLSCWKVLTQLH